MPKDTGVVRPTLAQTLRTETIQTLTETTLQR